jgi:hypothetical protein
VSKVHFLSQNNLAKNLNAFLNYFNCFISIVLLFNFYEKIKLSNTLIAHIFCDFKTIAYHSYTFTWVVFENKTNFRNIDIIISVLQYRNPWYQWLFLCFIWPSVCNCLSSVNLLRRLTDCMLIDKDNRPLPFSLMIQTYHLIVDRC